jgi:hypothetical protein
MKPSLGLSSNLASRLPRADGDHVLLAYWERSHSQYQMR